MAFGENRSGSDNPCVHSLDDGLDSMEYGCVKEFGESSVRTLGPLLWLRSVLESQLYDLGCGLYKHAGKVIFVGVLILSTLCVGLKSAVTVTDLEDLWVQEGGRLEEELDYAKVELGEGAGSVNQLVIQTPEDPDVNILYPQALLDHLDILSAATRVSVDVYDTTWQLKDLCYAPSAPAFELHFVDQIMENLFPCAVITPLDCFWEGSKLVGPDYPVKLPGSPTGVSWMSLHPQRLLRSLLATEELKETLGAFPIATLEDFLKRAGIGSGYQEKPCLDPFDPQCPPTSPNYRKGAPDVGAEVTGGCYGFATKYMHWDETFIVGGVEKNRTGHIVRARAFQTTVQLMGERELYDFHVDTFKVHNLGWSQEKAARVIRHWQRAFEQEVRELTEERKTETSHQFLLFSSSHLAELMKEYTQVSPLRIAIGCAAMAVYTLIALARRRVSSQAGLGISGVLLTCLAVAAGLGICAMLGIPFNASTTQIVPFLALGLGMDDLFFLCHTFRMLSPASSAGAHETLTMQERTGEALRRGGFSVIASSAVNLCGFLGGIIIPLPALRSFCLQTAILLSLITVVHLTIFVAMCSLDLRRQAAQHLDCLACFQPATPQDLQRREPLIDLLSSWSKLHCLPALRQKQIQTLVLVFTLSLIAFGFSGAYHMKDGLDLTDIVPRGSPEYKFLAAQEDFFGYYNIFAVTGKEFEYPGERQQQLLYEFHAAFVSIPEIIKNDDGGVPPFWLGMFRDWLKGLQATFDREYQLGTISREGWKTNASSDAVMAYKLIVQTGHNSDPVDKTQIDTVRLVNDRGVIHPPAFYNYLSAWASNDAVAYSASQASITPLPRLWQTSMSDYDLKVPKSQPIKFAQLPFFLAPHETTEDLTKTIARIREVCDEFKARGLPNFPSGIPFTFWEQYVGLRIWLAGGLLVGLVGTSVLIGLCTASLWSGLLSMALLSALLVSLWGSMATLLGLSLNAVPAVLLICSLGIASQAVIRILLKFLSTSGARGTRLDSCIHLLSIPLFHSSITTLLGVLMLTVANFDFVVRYFFFSLLLLVLLASFYGCLVLPVLLNLIGPPPQPQPPSRRLRLHLDSLPPAATGPPAPEEDHFQRVREEPLQSRCRSGRRLHVPIAPVPPGAAHSRFSRRPSRERRAGGGSGPPVPPSPASSAHPPPAHPSQLHHSNLSLSTITEEPSSSVHSSTRSSHSGTPPPPYAAPSPAPRGPFLTPRAITVEPEFTVETTADPSGETGGGTRVTATAKIEVQLHHAPNGCGASGISVASGTASSSTSSSSSSSRSRDLNRGTRRPRAPLLLGGGVSPSSPSCSLPGSPIGSQDSSS